MDAERLETLLRSLSETPSRRGALRLLFASALGGLITVGALPTVAKKKQKVTLCHNGQTISVSKKAKKKHLKHGDAVGPCQPPPPPIFRFAADPMTGANEVPPEDPGGNGSAQFTIQGSTICGTFQLTTTPPSTVTGTHIHAGASGAEGGIVVDFGAALNQQTCVTCPSAACPNASTPSNIIANPAGFYGNIHTLAFSEGAVRAQLQAVP